jgi:predicted nicotinamide N-methyase
MTESNPHDFPNSALSHLPKIHYQTAIETVSLADGLSIELETLKNLNETIDQVFEILAREGQPDLLEKLCPYFGVVWPSARALVEVLSRGEFMKGAKAALEVGCGLAIPSLALAKAGHPVFATDFHPEVPRFLTRNIELNQIAAGHLRYQALDWTQDAQALAKFSGQHGPFDRVYGSDILYEAHHADRVPEVLAQLLHPRDGRALIADPARPYLQRFVDQMEKQGFQAKTEILTAQDYPVAKEIFVLEFYRA